MVCLYHKEKRRRSRAGGSSVVRDEGYDYSRPARRRIFPAGASPVIPGRRVAGYYRPASRWLFPAGGSPHIASRAQSAWTRLTSRYQSESLPAER